MNNNTQIETVEDFCKKYRKYLIEKLNGIGNFSGDGMFVGDVYEAMIDFYNWQKQQDEAKYKETPVNYLLTNALRSLNEEQLNSLTLSLIERSKYKELLESHNELLEFAEHCCNNYVWNNRFKTQELINKAKNIKQ
jgi:hypothetical protein